MEVIPGFRAFLTQNGPHINPPPLSWCPLCLEVQRSHSRSSSRSSLEETLASQPRSKDATAASSSPSPPGARAKPPLDYGFYMATVLPKHAAVASAAASPLSQSPQSSPGADKKVATSCPTSCLRGPNLPH